MIEFVIFNNKVYDFTDDLGRPKKVVVIVGSNNSGKSEFLRTLRRTWNIDDYRSIGMGKDLDQLKPYFEKIYGKGSWANWAELGDGAWNVVKILKQALYPFGNKIICIDDIELRLDPTRQYRLMKVLISIAEEQKRQFFITTTSTHICLAVPSANIINLSDDALKDVPEWQYIQE